MRVSLRFTLAMIAVAAIVSGSVVGQTGRPSLESPLPVFEVFEKSIEDLQRAMQAREVTSRQLVDLYIARIRAYDQQGPSLNAITTLNPRARAAADALDAERARKGPRGPLHGIPVLVKDNYETEEMATSAGSIALADFHPMRDAFMVRKLKDAGAVILGKTNMHELAAGITTVGSRFGQTKNPYDLDRTPGGSSGGTGAAVAANFSVAGMGSDTCGSIRIPAANNNLVGLRGTQGLSSRTGIVPLSSSQDIGGPITRSIDDLAIMLDATVGVDAADAQTAGYPSRTAGSFRSGLKADALKGARIGAVRAIFGAAPEDQEVATVIQKALDELTKRGAEVIDVVIPGLDDLLRDSSMINADFKFDLADYLAKSEAPPVRSLGEILDGGLYHSALEATFRARNAVEARDTEQSRRARIKQALLRQVTEATLKEHRLTAMIYPTLPRRPARLGEAQTGRVTCQLSAHSGLPALAVPAGFTADSVPIGMELLGAAFSDTQLVSLGYSIEQTLRLRRPPFSTPAIVNGKAPAPHVWTMTTAAGATVNLSYDETTATIHYAITANEVANQRLQAIWIHTGGDKPTAARHRLYGPGQPLAGTVTLSGADRRDLVEGRLVLRLFSLGASHRPETVPLRLQR